MSSSVATGNNENFDLELGRVVQEETSIDVPLNDMNNSVQPFDENPINLPKFKTSIIGTETRQEDPEHQSLIHDNRFTVYEIKATNENDSQTHYVFRRFSEFVKLVNHLAEKYADKASDCEQLHSFLPKQPWFWTNKFAKEVIDDRTEKLTNLLDFISSHEIFRNDEQYFEFLQCDMKMLEKALSYYRNRLYHFQQSRKDLKNKDEYERSQEMVRQLTRKRSESLSKKH
ncbi:PX domain-containing protein [Naegleria gruberi]|uniref:PX domain-containing protein n=1 Tax=Naegleria gruberi TaxID=5762 RepID=D2VV52_NAEGR|nr:PX domain-containing protein [Naegleria gruberi]EFC39247.1 PX domain-containing protein [Naegleria gruberi]|eukprot:XP_002671991.1 PX domain-containing protein [Naegleria gruberi strain NEG-M]